MSKKKKIKIVTEQEEVYEINSFEKEIEEEVEEEVEFEEDFEEDSEFVIEEDSEEIEEDSEFISEEEPEEEEDMDATGWLLSSSPKTIKEQPTVEIVEEIEEESIVHPESDPIEMQNDEIIEISNSVRIIDGNKFIVNEEILSGFNGKYIPYEKAKGSSIYKWISDSDNHSKVLRETIHKHVNKDSVVLEIGGFIGVTSCLINSIVDEKSKHVVVEVEDDWIKYLKLNKDLNNCHFKIRESHQGVINKFELDYKFDTLVIDANGVEHSFIVNNANYLRDNIKTVIVCFYDSYNNGKMVPQKVKFDALSSIERYFLRSKIKNNCYVFRRMNV